MTELIGANQPEDIFGFNQLDDLGNGINSPHVIYGTNALHAGNGARNPPSSMPDQWNQLFLRERIEKVSTLLGTQVFVDIGGVAERNQNALTKNVHLKYLVDEDEINLTNLSLADIQSEVGTYRMESTNGVALVFIVEKLVRNYERPRGSHAAEAALADKSNGASAIYVVFFDIATRHVLTCERIVHHVTEALNFRNFWFGPVKETESGLAKYRLKDKPAPNTLENRRK